MCSYFKLPLLSCCLFDFHEKFLGKVPECRASAGAQETSVCFYLHAGEQSRKVFLLQNPLQSYPKNPLLCSADPELIVPSKL
jgi:hypothetical protein